MINTFVYGSLKCDDARDALICSKYQKLAVRLEGYARLCVTAEACPGPIASKGDSVDGILVLDVSRQDLDVLDRFEGYLYSSKRVQMSTCQNDLYEADSCVFRKKVKACREKTGGVPINSRVMVLGN